MDFSRPSSQLLTFCIITASEKHQGFDAGDNDYSDGDDDEEDDDDDEEESMTRRLAFP